MSNNKKIEEYLDRISNIWDELVKTKESFRINYFNNFLKGRIKYYSKNKYFSLIWESVNENLYFCFNFIEEWLKFSRNNIKNDFKIYNTNSDFFNIINIFNMLFISISELNSLNNELFYNNNPEWIDDFDNFHTFIQLIRNFLVHPVSFFWKDKYTNALFFDNNNFIKLKYENEFLCKDDFKKLFNDSNKIRFYLTNNFITLWPRGIYHLLLKEPQIEAKYIYKSTVKSLYISIMPWEIIINSFKKTSLFLKELSNIKRYKIKDKYKKKIVYQKRININYESINLNFNDFQKNTNNKKRKIRFFYKPIGTKKVIHRWVLEIWENDCWKKIRDFKKNYIRNGVKASLIFENLCKKDKIIIVENVILNNNFHYAIYENFTSVLMQILFLNDIKNNMFKSFKNYEDSYLKNISSTFGNENYWDYFFCRCDVFEIDWNKIRSYIKWY